MMQVIRTIEAGIKLDTDRSAQQVRVISVEQKCHFRFPHITANKHAVSRRTKPLNASDLELDSTSAQNYSRPIDDIAIQIYARACKQHFRPFR